MTQKNETLTLIASFLVTLGILCGGLWWLFQTRQNKSAQTETNDEPSSSSASLPDAPNTFNEVKNVPSGSFNYSGSRNWIPIRESIDPIIQQTYPNFRLRYQTPRGEGMSAGQGIERLLADQLAFTLSSRLPKPGEYDAAQAQGHSLKAIPVAIDGLAIVVNPNLEVSGLTIAQLQEIYTGELSNWQEVGGPDVAIIPYSSQNNQSRIFFSNQVLKGENWGSNVQFVDPKTSVLKTVTQTPGAVYYAVASEVVSQCVAKILPIGRQPNQFIPPYQPPEVSETACREQGQRNQLNVTAFQTKNYPLTQRWFVVVKLDGRIDQQAGETYGKLLLTEQGQDLIRSTGFVNIR
ncbi:phosphate ABC transporter substrate-binding protein, PhoT family [Halothece sp. PCC 7418]|uniref:PstS family phosphate ABC transporter substrate-binding protein n=1 Tax=Halothece sp. (strain PCC 7418) TaxID=65093 RepID=UPI0002A067A0|nr:substrate-binding domain-containing protein [Halothece sp. PCC 7418]AFZ44009.1 phosphate ABC transporter substrate-binding protein, PhoT family [Halothece sp. PCC 7418]